MKSNRKSCVNSNIGENVLESFKLFLTIMIRFTGFVLCIYYNSSIYVHQQLLLFIYVESRVFGSASAA